MATSFVGHHQYCALARCVALYIAPEKEHADLFTLGAKHIIKENSCNFVNQYKFLNKKIE